MPKVSCQICFAVLCVKPSHLKKGWGKFCSKKCQYQSQLNGSKFQCSTCQKDVYRTPKDVKNSDSGNFFCSRSCTTVWRNKFLYSGPNHANWKDGGDSYRRVLLVSNKPQICTLCEIKNPQLLAAHHIDRDRENNDLKNLIWLCHNCHFLVHHNKDAATRLEDLLKVESLS